MKKSFIFKLSAVVIVLAFMLNCTPVVFAVDSPTTNTVSDNKNENTNHINYTLSEAVFDTPATESIKLGYEELLTLGQETVASVETSDNDEPEFTEPELVSPTIEKSVSVEILNNDKTDIATDPKSTEHEDVSPPVEASASVEISDNELSITASPEAVVSPAEKPDTVKSEASAEVSEKETPTVVYNTSALTFNKIPAYILSSIGVNELSAEKTPVGLAEEDMQQLNSFTTVNADGSNTLYLFGSPIKYLDRSTNQIKFIDNSIVPVLTRSEVTTPVEGEADLQQLDGPLTVTGYTNAANDFSINMPVSVNDGISLIKGELAVTFYPAVSAISSAILSTETIGAMTEQVVEYPNALGNGAHLQYVPISNGIKENIILDSYTGTNTFGFIIEAQGCYPLYTEGEAIPFAKTGTEEVSFILGQVDARDSYTGEETDGHFTLYNNLSLIEIKPGIYGLTVTVDPDFLADPDTVYPVVIDPSVTIPSSYMQDTTVYSGIPNGQNYYSSAYNIVGNHGSSYGVGTAFIKTTNLSNYSYILPGNITSATYKVYEGSGKTNSVLVRVGRPRFDWPQNTITYNSRPRTDPVSFLTINESGWKTFDITDIVWDWMSYVDMKTHLTDIYGFSLEAVNASDSSLHFCSVNHSTYAPSIIVNYNNSGQTIDLEALYTRNGDAAFKAFGYLIHGTSPEFKIKIATAGTYYIQTLNCEPQFDDDFSSTANIKLTNISGQQLTLSNATYSMPFFSYKSVYLSTGTYYLTINNSSGTRTNVRCYVIMERSGQLREQYGFYANKAKDFYKVGDASYDYSCLSYVIRNRSSWVDLYTFEPSAITQLQNYGCEEEKQPNNPCFVLYGCGADYISHILIVEWNLVKSKWGDAELVRHSKLDVFFDYGHPFMFFTDPFAS